MKLTSLSEMDTPYSWDKKRMWKYQQRQWLKNLNVPRNRNMNSKYEVCVFDLEFIIFWISLSHSRISDVEDYEYFAALELVEI